MSFEIEGKLYKIYPTEQKTQSFQAREFAIEIMSGSYPQYIKFQLTQDKCSVIDDYTEGDMIKVYFDLRGREWQDKIFSNLNAWRVEKAGQAAAAVTTTKTAEPPIYADDSFTSIDEPMRFDNDLPF
jgi:single-strand DNA-binding protein